MAILDELEIYSNVTRFYIDYYVPPGEIVKAMAGYLSGGQPQSVYDPYAGSGGMLAEAARIGTIKLAHGVSRVVRLERLARLRMVLLEEPVKFTIHPYPESEKKDDRHLFDIILSNPPYGGKLEDDPWMAVGGEWYPIVGKLNRLDAAFLCHILSHLAEDGHAAVLLPTFFLAGPRVKALMSRVLNENLLDGVMMLPQGTFQDTSIAPALFLLSKGRKDERRIYLVDATKEFDRRGRQVQIKFDRLEKLIHKIKTRDDTPEPGFIVVTVEEVLARGCDLRPWTYFDKHPAKRAASTQILRECDQLALRLDESRKRIEKLIWGR